jgi:3-hydroxyisobutyrate dehydrogenase
MKKVGLIGLGIMGGGMAGQLLAKGYSLTVWNRDASKAKDLVEKGAKLAASPAELAGEVEVVLSMVRDDAAVREVLLGQNGALSAARSGTAFIDLSTTGPKVAHELAEAAKAKGCSFLHAPVTGSKDAAASGKLNLLVGGDEADLAAQREVLEAISASITLVGPVGSSAVLKLANNQFAAVMIAALGESLALGEAAGLKREMLLNVMEGTVNRVYALKKAKIANRDWSTEFALDLMHKDMTLTLQAANDATIPMPIGAVARESFQQARSEGKGSLDFSSVAE